MQEKEICLNTSENVLVIRALEVYGEQFTQTHCLKPQVTALLKRFKKLLGVK